MPTAPGYLLPEHAVTLLQEVFDWYRRLHPNRSSSNAISDIGQAPEVYVGYTQTAISDMNSGLMAGTGSGLEDDTPGVGVAQIYTIDDDGEMTKITGMEVDVYNVSSTPIRAGSWIIVAREKFGKWLVLSASGAASSDLETVGTGTGTSDGGGGGSVDVGDYNYCDLVGTPTDACLEAVSTDTGHRVGMTGSGTARVWTSDSPIEYVSGQFATVVFGISGGSLYVTLGGVQLVNCGSGCWAGGPMTGHPSGSEAGICGSIFKICIKCVPCPPQDTGCCDPRPADILYATYSDLTGTCTCMPASHTLVYNGTADCWEAPIEDTYTCLIMECEENARAILCCVAGEYSWNGGTPPTSQRCTPFELIFDKTINGGSYRVTITA